MRGRKPRKAGFSAFCGAAIEYENRISITFRLVSGGGPLSDVSFMG